MMLPIYPIRVCTTNEVIGIDDGSGDRVGLGCVVSSGNLRRRFRWRERLRSILRLPFDHLSTKITITIKGRANLRPIQDFTRVMR
jgi:hypothetical protein